MFLRIGIMNGQVGGLELDSIHSKKCPACRVLDVLKRTKSRIFSTRQTIGKWRKWWKIQNVIPKHVALRSGQFIKMQLHSHRDTNSMSHIIIYEVIQGQIRPNVGQYRLSIGITLIGHFYPKENLKFHKKHNDIFIYNDYSPAHSTEDKTGTTTKLITHHAQIILYESYA